MNEKEYNLFLKHFLHKKQKSKSTYIGRNHMGTLVRMVLYDFLEVLVTRISVSVEQRCGSCQTCTLLMHLTFLEKQDTSKTRQHFSMDILESVAGASFFPVVLPFVISTNSWVSMGLCHVPNAVLNADSGI